MSSHSDEPSACEHCQFPKCGLLRKNIISLTERLEQKNGELQDEVDHASQQAAIIRERDKRVVELTEERDQLRERVSFLTDLISGLTTSIANACGSMESHCNNVARATGLSLESKRVVFMDFGKEQDDA